MSGADRQEAARQVAGRGRGRPPRRQLGAGEEPHTPARRPARGDRGPATAADDRGRDRRGARHGTRRLASVEEDSASQERSRSRSRPTATSERGRRAIHVDVKKLGRIEGGAANACRPADGAATTTVSCATPPGSAGTRSAGVRPRCRRTDATRLAYVEVLPDEKGPTAEGSCDGRSQATARRRKPAAVVPFSSGSTST